MRNRYLWAGALALAVGTISQIETKAAVTNSLTGGLALTNGTILVTTRAAGDGHFFTQSSSSTLDDMDDARGSGCSPGDVAMCELLQDNGYSTRLLPDKVLSTYQNPVTAGLPTLDVYGNPNTPVLYYSGQDGPANTTAPYDPALSAMLVVVSGSGSSSDAIQPNTYGVPIVVGEHAILGGATSAPGGHGEVFLYSNYSGNHGNQATTGGLNQYMLAVNTNHPIWQGIPLVSIPGGGPGGDTGANYIKFLRDPYPNENAHVLPGTGLPNYQVSTTYVDTSDPTKNIPAPGLTILGRLAANTNFVIFACMDQGGGLATDNTDSFNPWSGLTTAPTRVVHFFVCEQGSGNTRRSFNALTVWGRILFVRCCQWAMWEGPQPYQGLGIIDVGLASPGNIRLSWTGSSQYNYRIYGASDLLSGNWLPIADSITNRGEGVTVTRTLNIASAPQAAYLKVATLPFNYFNP